MVSKERIWESCTQASNKWNIVDKIIRKICVIVHLRQEYYFKSNIEYYSSSATEQKKERERVK